ncbi:uncharacterized protein MYCFIDRAFT_215833 [Pseudocercospora fijiensis CIRAD86]|uniref:Uncharacterized protein n=1 Tax=Pseudocercospora fijiensis (strain CIRAD86) TaxID=383855 RepID=M3AUC2_PSEFD|nr:uncharacterized protein MYCFIDRAFT_215833 [Pseudocercospora fijiensis CIRAD86]EME81082.1 hypothetical protein MYCFIDRAFT_215833 [Pseudocercospora fijiensis CIRAD86]
MTIPHANNSAVSSDRVSTARHTKVTKQHARSEGLMEKRAQQHLYSSRKVAKTKFLGLLYLALPSMVLGWFAGVSHVHVHTALLLRVLKEECLFCASKAVDVGLT